MVLKTLSSLIFYLGTNLGCDGNPAFFCVNDVERETLGERSEKIRNGSPFSPAAEIRDSASPFPVACGH